MIKITNGRKVFMVSSGAYRNYFKHMGYKPVEDAQTPENPEQENAHPHEENPGSEDSTVPPEEEEVPVDNEEEYEDEEDLSEIPLSEMKLSQLIAYAEQLGLDHDGTPTKRELRALIREHLANQ